MINKLSNVSPKRIALDDNKAANEPRVATLMRPRTQNDCKNTTKSPRDPRFLVNLGMIFQAHLIAELLKRK